MKPDAEDSPELARLLETAAGLARSVLAPAAEEVDLNASWPARGLRAVAAAGLAGLPVPLRLGGLGQGLLALVKIAEQLGAGCSSTAMCFAMHCVATKVIAVRATAEQEDRYLRPIAKGMHLSSLALSEPGTGANFYLPRTRFRADGECFVLDGEKSFVTSGGHADSYVLSAAAPGAEFDPGTFTCMLVNAQSDGLDWLQPWRGLGMRGNSSRSLRLTGARIPRANLLGAEGDQVWYVFEVIAPYFLGAIAGVYLGIAQAALDCAAAHLQGRKHEHTGESLAAIPALSAELAEMWIAIERARQLVYHAARLVDAARPEANPALFAAKVEVAETAVAVTNAALKLAGGRAYQENSTLARLLRDAQAANVMAPTTHVLKGWLGRSLLGLPLLQA